MRCKIYQWMIESELDSIGCVRKPRTLAHLETCSACRAYHNQLVLLGKQLTVQSAINLESHQIQSLQAGIFHQLDLSMAQTEPQKNLKLPPRALISRVASLAAGVLLAVLAGLLMNYFESKPTKPVPEGPIAVIRMQSQQLSTEFAMLTYLTKQPMQIEIQKLEIDTINALNFLKEFAPSNLIHLASIESEQSPDETVQ